MTTTNKEPVDRIHRRPLGQHPAFCLDGHWCDVRRQEHPDGWVYEYGTHARVLTSWTSLYGRRTHIALVVEALEGDGPFVQVMFPHDEGDLGWTGEEMTVKAARWSAPENRLEPEEARLLARYLIEAADACERARQQ